MLRASQKMAATLHGKLVKRSSLFERKWFFGFLKKIFFTRERGHAVRTRVGLTLILFVLIANTVQAETSSSSSYQLDYARFTNASGQQTSENYQLTDSISNIGVEGNSSNYLLRNVYSSIPENTPACGNSIIETGEECEGSNFNNLSCHSFGFDQGNLQCISCAIVTTACFDTVEGGETSPSTEGNGGGGYICGNSIREASEQCDDGNLEAGDGCSSYCFIEPGVLEVVHELSTSTFPDIEKRKLVPVSQTSPLPASILLFPSRPETKKKPLPEDLPESEKTLLIESETKPSAPEMDHYQFHFEYHKKGEWIDTEDETPFIVTMVEPNQGYELIIFGADEKEISHQAVESNENGLLMTEIASHLEEGAYKFQLRDKDKMVVENWSMVVEPLKAAQRLNSDIVNLGVFSEIESFSGSGKAFGNHYAFIQQKNTAKNDVIFLKITGDALGHYKIKPPQKLTEGTYFMNVVEVYSDKTVSINKGYSFEIKKEIVKDISPRKKSLYPLIIPILIMAMAILGWLLNKMTRRKRRGIFFIILLSLGLSQLTFGAITTPGVFIYEGKLLDTNGDAITTAHTFRFSLWSSDNFVAGDLLGDGTIDITAPTYGGWQETHVVTPNMDGTFFVELGSITPLPNMILVDLTDLMVEIKEPADPDTDYEVLDPTGDNGADTDDRQTIGSAPYSNNADYLDNVEVGTSAGDLATLGIGDVWDISYIPGATNADSWTIDENDTVRAGGTVDLIFGNTLAQVLSFDVDNDWFEFSNDVSFDQHEIKNVALDNLAVAPLTPVTGQIYHNTTDGNSYVWNGLSWEDITAGTGGVQQKAEVFQTEYKGSTFNADGLSNKGLLNSYFADGGGTDKHNYYEWTTGEATLQDIDIVISFRLPNDFQSFTGSPLSLLYRTSDGVSATNQVDVAFYDTTGTAVVLTGGTDLANANWTTANMTFGGGETFTAGEVVTLTIKPQTTNAGYARVSDIVFNYIGN